MVNKVLLIGRVGGEPEITTMQSGIMVGTFSLATSEKFKDKTGKIQENTEWHTIRVWDKLAGITQKYIHKGALIFIIGKIAYRAYTDKNGQKHSVTEIVAKEMHALSRQGQQQSQYQGQQQTQQQQSQYQQQPQQQQQQQDYTDGAPDDLPF